jgi:hypothetical protein
MSRCEIWSNDHDKAFQIMKDGRSHTFDSFECAIHARAPSRAQCGIRIVGHGMEKSGKYYCCRHCAEKQGAPELHDRA